jgi:curved DNA-binding protein CbpA
MFLEIFGIMSVHMTSMARVPCFLELSNLVFFHFKMKKKDKRGAEPVIREINVDQLVRDLGDRNEGHLQSPKRNDEHRRPHTVRASTPSGHDQGVMSILESPQKSKVGDSGDTLTGNDDEAGVKQDVTLRSVSPPFVGEKMSRSKKQRLRLLRKLQSREPTDMRQESDIPNAESSEDLSDDEASRGDPRDKQPKSARHKPKRNYVERSSAAYVSAVTTGSCGWKDIVCIFFVILLIGIAGFLKFQEEMFGSVDHIRSESDADVDFYEILGVPHSATTREIKRAYRNKVMEVHPDRHPGCKDCAPKFIATTKAYEVLVDEDKRKVYEQTRGSYDPILSDYSVSLTTFNYQKLVKESPAVWVIQVYDDIEPGCKSFASAWDMVAGSKMSTELVKFGRVNVRRDRALLSYLPMRARSFPTVLMFSRDTLPSIFSLADMSSGALSRWIEKEVPSHVDENSSHNVYTIEISGKAGMAPFIVKTASVFYYRIFNFEYKQDRSLKNNNFRVRLISSGSETSVGGTLGAESLVAFLTSVKERLVIPVNRDNLLEVCGSAGTEYTLHCQFTDSLGAGIWNSSKLVGDSVLIQRVFSDTVPAGVTVDLVGEQRRNSSSSVFESMDSGLFIDHHFPLSFKRHLKTLLIATIAATLALAFSRIGAVQITIGVGLMSVIVGILSSPLGEWVHAKLR